jgi:hypothetical protein
MRQHTFFIALGLGSLGLAASLAGCGDFSADDPDPEATGGTTAGSGGSDMATGGTTGDGTGGTTQEPPEVSCDNESGCGGDVKGAWFAIDSCLTVTGKANLTAHGVGCVEADAEGTIDVTGNWTVGDDGTLTDTTQTTGTIHYTLAPECKDVSGTVTQCDAIAGPMFASLGFEREGSFCEDSETVEGGCDCTGVLDQAGAAAFVTTAVAAEGLYETMGNTLTFTGYEVVDYDYCVDGNFMHVTPATLNDIGTVTGTILFQRQP